MLIDRESLPRHRPWIVSVLILTVAASIWFVIEAIKVGGRPSGSSLPCLTFGIAGGLIILFEFLLWPRKWFRSTRWLGRAQTWLRAHIWLGLLCLPLAVFHSGFRLGGGLATILMFIFLGVIGSGVFGLVLQQFVPSRILDEVPAETIHSQIGYVLTQLRHDADELVGAVCGVSVGRPGEPLAGASVRGGEGPLVVGSISRVGGAQGKVLHTLMPGSPVAGSEILLDFYRDEIRPFLKEDGDANSPLGAATTARGMFDDLRQKLNLAAHPALQVLESACEQRRQMLQQARLQFWLHSWLWVHLPLSAALLILLIVHVIVASRYW